MDQGTPSHGGQQQAPGPGGGGEDIPQAYASCPTETCPLSLCPSPQVGHFSETQTRLPDAHSWPKVQKGSSGFSKPKRVQDPRAPASLPGPLIGDLQLLLCSLFHACQRSWPSLHTCRTLLQARLTRKQPPSKLQPSPSHGVQGLPSWAVPPQPAALRGGPCMPSRPQHHAGHPGLLALHNRDARHLTDTCRTGYGVGPTLRICPPTPTQGTEAPPHSLLGVEAEVHRGTGHPGPNANTPRGIGRVLVQGSDPPPSPHSSRPAPSWPSLVKSLL